MSATRRPGQRGPVDTTGPRPREAYSPRQRFVLAILGMLLGFVGFLTLITQLIGK